MKPFQESFTVRTLRIPLRVLLNWIQLFLFLLDHFRLKVRDQNESRKPLRHQIAETLEIQI